jgi:hypothetical protein
MTNTLITTVPDARPDDSISRAVVEAVADAEGISPLDVEPPLFEAIDPDALDGLFTESSLPMGATDGVVEFQYAGYVVTVRADGTVSLHE